MNFNEQQREIITTDASKVVVMAGAASGKTATLVARLQYLINSGIAPNKIVAITFTNNAAYEIMERIGTTTGLFVGTIHSYANRLLRANGIDTSDIIEEEQFDKLFERILKHPNCVKPVEYLLLDEAQDSTDNQFKFVLEMIKPKNWMLIGDFRQSIYGWRGAVPQNLIDLSKQRDVVCYDLNYNYRNDKKILAFAKSIIRTAGIDYIDRSIATSEIDGKVIDSKYDPIQLARFIKLREDYGKWFILTRTNEQLSYIGERLQLEGVPFDTFKKAQLNNAQLAAKMNENTVKLLTIHSAKGLEADNVAVIGSRMYNVEERCISYVAATRARHLLLWLNMPNIRERTQKTTNWEI